MTAAPGWYPDPSAPGQRRYWDGAQWTAQAVPEAPAPQVPPGVAQTYHAAPRAPMTAERAHSWALFAHLSALGTWFLFGLSFIGPLIVYLTKRRDDAFVADQAREALNFNLSALLYVVIGATVAFVMSVVFIVIAGVRLLEGEPSGSFLVRAPAGLALSVLSLAALIGWLVLVVVAAVQANRGTAHRYPLTIRFVRN